LADCFAFFLSAIDVESEIAKEKEGIEDFIETVEMQIADYIISLTQYKADTEDTLIAITELITYIGTDNEIKGVTTVERFAIAIFIAIAMFPGITWDQITAAYKLKSIINKERQEEDY
jgi:L-cystine uptake protein TcyP (sodium:dicarboxylate symporter family)